MASPSLHAHAARVARRLGVRVGLGLSGLLLVGLGLSLLSHYRFSVGRAVESHAKSFSFWLQVNDVFQIQRSLADLVVAEGLRAALVTDASGTLVAQKSDPELVPLLLRPRPVSLLATGFLLRREVSLYEIGLSNNFEGTIVYAVQVPYGFFIAWILFSIVITRLAIVVARRNILAVATSLTAPVNQLASAVARSGSLVDLPASVGEFAEIELLRRTMSDTGARLLAQEKELQEAARAKEIFELGRQVAHDIRSPVSALRLAVQAGKPFDEDRRALVVSATNRIEKIAADLLLKPRTAATPGFALLPACEEILREKKQALEGRTIELSIENERVGPEDLVRGQKDEFQRVLSNLINNSVEAMSNAGHVRLRLVRDGQARIVLADDGDGIAEDLLRELNSGRARSTKAAGHGLGTAHARKVVESWGGALRFQSRPGEGTTAEIEVPWV